MRHEPSPPPAEYYTLLAASELAETSRLSGEELLASEADVLSALNDIAKSGELIIEKMQKARAARLALSLHRFEGQAQ